MPLDDYASLGGGALRLKGGKVTKKKKKKEKGGLEKALSGGETAVVKAGEEGEKLKKDRKRKDEREGEGKGEEEERPVVRKTEAERRIDELKRKRVGYPLPPQTLDLVCRCERVWRVAVVLTAIVPRDGRESRGQTRAAKDAQGEGRGAEQLPVEAVGAQRHAQDRTRLRVPWRGISGSSSWEEAWSFGFGFGFCIPCG